MVVVLLSLHSTSAGVATVVVVLRYLHSTSADVATVVVVLQYLHNTSAGVASVVYVCNTCTVLQQMLLLWLLYCRFSTIRGPTIK